MKLFMFRTYLCTLSLLLGSLPAWSATYNQACYDNVMSGLVWDQAGHDQWSSTNAKALCTGTNNGDSPVDCFAAIIPGCTLTQTSQGGCAYWTWQDDLKLCAGTSSANEPINCYARLMRGEVNWGGGTAWYYKNAINLCQGTSNDNLTIGCFRDDLSRGKTWSQAIEDCHFDPDLTMPGGTSHGHTCHTFGCFCDSALECALVTSGPCVPSGDQVYCCKNEDCD